MAVSTTVNYQGGERYTLDGCEHHSTLPREREEHTLRGYKYHSKLPREREVHTQGL